MSLAQSQGAEMGTNIVTTYTVTMAVPKINTFLSEVKLTSCPFDSDGLAANPANY